MADAWTDFVDGVVAEIVADVPEPRWRCWQDERWSLRSTDGGWRPPYVELADLRSDWWWDNYQSWDSRQTFVRSQQSAAVRSSLSYTVELSPRARASIVRELVDWDGREQGGALVGRVVGDTIVIDEAGGLGVGVETERGQTWLKAPTTRYYDLAVALGGTLLGDWHSHRNSTHASSMDERAWEGVRKALRAPFFVGLVVAPRETLALGIHPALDEIELSFKKPRFGCYVATEHGVDYVPLTFT